MMRRDGEVVLALMLLTALVAAGEVLWGGRIWFLRDMTYLWHPFRTYAAEQIASGRFPLWNPYLFGGAPFFANPLTGILDPLGVSFWLAPFSGALAAANLLRLSLSAMGMFVLARSFGTGRAGAFVAGAIGGMGGWPLARLDQLTVLGAGAWGAWVLILCRGPWAAQSLVLAALWLAGRPPEALWIGGATLIWRIRGAHRLAAAAAAAVAIVAVQILPFMDLLGHTTRVLMSLKDAMLWALPSVGLVGMLGPAIRGDNAWQFAFWMGPAAFALALIGLSSSRGGRPSPAAGGFSRPAVRLLLITLAGLAAALGPALPLSRALWAWPPFSWARYPSTWLVLAWIGLASLAGLGCGRLGRRGWKTAIALLVAVDLARIGWGIIPTMPRDYFSGEPGVARFLRAHLGAARFAYSPRTETLPPRGEGRTVEAQFRNLRERMPPNVGMTSHLNQAGGYDALVPETIDAAWRKTARVSDPEAGLAGMAAFDVRYVLSDRPIQTPSARLAWTGPVLVYENLKWRPAPVSFVLRTTSGVTPDVLSVVGAGPCGQRAIQAGPPVQRLGPGLAVTVLSLMLLAFRGARTCAA